MLYWQQMKELWHLTDDKFVAAYWEWVLVRLVSIQSKGGLAVVAVRCIVAVTFSDVVTLLACEVIREELRCLCARASPSQSVPIWRQ